MGNYEPVTDDPSFNLQERQQGGNTSPHHHYSPQFDLNRTTTTVTHNYKPNLNYPNVVVPSTSKQLEPIITACYLDDDVQPCSSKSVDNNYRMA